MTFAGSAFTFGLTCYIQTIIYPSDASNTITRFAAITVFGTFIFASFLEHIFNCPLENYAFGLSLVRFAAFVPGTCSLIKYYFQIRINIIKQSTRGVSKYAYWSDFAGNVCCGTQLQIDSMIAGYSFFFNDPHFNLAKALIVACGTINTMIILSQIYIIYGEPEENEKK